MFSSGHLRNLFLDDNGMREVESGAFDEIPKLEHMWMGGNVLNCSSVQLPDGAQCLKAECGADYLLRIGDRLGEHAGFDRLTFHYAEAPHHTRA